MSLMPSLRRHLLPACLLGLLAVPAAVAGAQCPDGTPPPCSGRGPVPPAVRPVPPPPLRARQFLVLPFRNISRQPGQEWLVEGATTMLGEALSRWQGLRVVPDEQLYPALRRAGVVPGTVVPAATARRLAEETGGWTAVTGEVVAAGGRVRVAARAWDVVTSRELLRTAAEVPVDGDVRAAFDSVSLRLLGVAGLDAVPDVVQAGGGGNLDAYRAYLRGVAAQRRGEVAVARGAFEEAVRLDSSFALGWASLAAVLTADQQQLVSGNDARMLQASARAVALSAALPPRRRLLLRAQDALLHAQFEEARRTLTGLLAVDSGDAEALAALAVVEFIDPILVAGEGGERPRGSPQRAVSLARRALAVAPDNRAMFSLIIGAYARAGVTTYGPSPLRLGPVVGVRGSATSLSQLVVLQADRRRTASFIPVLLRDTLTLVPADSARLLSREVLASSRQAARQGARAWVDRWLETADGEVTPWVLAAELASLDGDLEGALRALRLAEARGVPPSAWPTPARRLVFLARGGRMTEAGRLLDSLMAAKALASWALPANEAALAWAFNTQLAHGRFRDAAAVLELFARGTPGLSLGTSVRVLLDPRDEVPVPPALRRQQLDTLLAGIAAVPPGRLTDALPTLAPTLARLVPSRSLAEWLVEAAGEAAGHGHVALAFDLAMQAIDADRTVAPRLGPLAWFRERLARLDSARGTAAARMRPTSATVTADGVVFTWHVQDSLPFPRDRVTTPTNTVEYGWEVALHGDDRSYLGYLGAREKVTAATPRDATLAELAGRTAVRIVHLERHAPTGEDTVEPLPPSALAVEVTAGTLRMTLSDPALVQWVRSARPREAAFRFLPCRVAADGTPACAVMRRSMVYP